MHGDLWDTNIKRRFHDLVDLLADNMQIFEDNSKFVKIS